MTAYQYRLAAGVSVIDQAEWRNVCGASGNPFLDMRFLRAVEIAFGDEARFWYATLSDDSGTPVCCAAFSRYVVDVGDFAPPAMQPAIAAIRRVFPRFL